MNISFDNSNIKPVLNTVCQLKTPRATMVYSLSLPFET